MMRRVAWITELVLVIAICTMASGLARAQSAEVLAERIAAMSVLGVLQDERISRTELAIVRIDDRMFYLLVGVAGNLFACAVMVGMQYVSSRKKDE